MFVFYLNRLRDVFINVLENLLNLLFDFVRILGEIITKGNARIFT